MNIDEYKALRLRRTLLQAEIRNINQKLDAYDFGGPIDTVDAEEETWMPLGAKGTPREEFYKQAERDSINSGAYRNTDTNGNYITPEDC